LRFLVDAYHPREYGGTGQVADWSIAAHIAARHNVILAGGLNSTNVLAATQQVSPWGIDVSSGVERDGVKDPRLIREFVSAAHTSP
jgi:phosphoribosylanthranilate isomerase